MASSGWLYRTRRTYFGNAAAQRDFRVQLRGNRSVLLFGVYLAILILVAYVRYDAIARDASTSVVEAQRQLKDFYTLIVELLAGMVALVTPALAATTVVLERQRRSLDLVFSAPVEPRYYLVGKMIAVYRYIWMLLILSLPVTAACVVLGGASWSDVLTIYLLLSVHGLLFAAIGLLLSTTSPKPVSAVVVTYLVTVSYLIVTGMLGATVAVSSIFRRTTGEVAFPPTLNPFTAYAMVGTYTTIWGHAVPNWVLGSLVMFVMIRLCLLGAGALLSDGRETVNLRANWLIFAVLAAFGLSAWFVGSGAYGSTTRIPSPPPENWAFQHADPKATILGYGLFWLLVPLVCGLPNLAVYGYDGAQRQRPNGWFSFRRTLDGTPAGGLPFILGLIALIGVAELAGVAYEGGALPDLSYLYYVVYTVGFWGLFWAIGRAASSLGVGLRAARTAVVVAFILIVAIPAPFLSSIAGAEFGEPGFSVWDLYLLRPVLQVGEVRPLQVLAYGLGLIALSFGLLAWSERRLRRREAALA